MFNLNKAIDDIENGVRGVIMSRVQINAWIYLLLLLFIGPFGIHRISIGKIWSGLLWLVTGGLFGVGVTLDFLALLYVGIRDCYGEELEYSSVVKIFARWLFLVGLVCIIFIVIAEIML